MWGHKLVRTNLAQFLKQKQKEKEEKKHLEVKLFLSHAQAKSCSKVIVGLA